MSNFLHYTWDDVCVSINLNTVEKIECSHWIADNKWCTRIFLVDLDELIVFDFDDKDDAFKFYNKLKVQL